MNTAKVYEKLDGSIIKLWKHNGQVIVSTNGKINAYDGDFGKMFDRCLKDMETPFDLNNPILDEYTLMFEMCTPENQVVVPHNSYKLYLIGARNNNTLQEIDIENLDLGFEIPKIYPLMSLAQLKENANELPFNDEGYIVVDGNFNRVKIKSPSYVATHHMANRVMNTLKGVIHIVVNREVEEFLVTFPHLEENITVVEGEYQSILSEVEELLEKVCSMTFETKKCFALYVLKTPYAHIMFDCKKNDNFTIEYVKNFIKNNSNILTQRVEKLQQSLND